MSTENDELQYWLEQEPITNAGVFLAPDTPTAPSEILIKTQLENNQKKHERIVERLINQQVWALNDFQAAFADRIDPSLIQAPETKSGYFEFIRGQDFLVERQGEIHDLLNQLQTMIQDGKEDTIPIKDLVSQNINDPVDNFTDQIKVIYDSELKVLRDRQKDLSENFQREYIEQKGNLHQQLTQFVKPPLQQQQQQQRVPVLQSSGTSIVSTTNQIENEKTRLPSKRMRSNSPPTQPRNKESRVSPPRRVPIPQTQQSHSPAPGLTRVPSRDPRIRTMDSATTGNLSNSRSPEVAVATPITTPSNNSYKNPPAIATPSNNMKPPEVASSSSPAMTSSLKPRAKPLFKNPSINASLLDRSKMDMVGADVFLIERQSKTRVRLGEAKDFDNALHAPQEDSPIYVRYLQGEQWFYRARDHARIGLVSKIEPMIRKYLLQT
ncbi:hypothetical protein INT45_013074 [Circinella minor]|uniref:Uncharacterized protein n=1 Tax=Circinella minor TaxID=1195481 RepID=A0A8H7S0J1_9FUNG|nr:hypothetical protein INT45_013074 [Circinella minor]